MHVLAGTDRKPSNYLTFVNPYDPTRRIAFYNCSTHNLKNYCNAAKARYFQNGKRWFKFKGIQFGWGHVEAAYNSRDCAKEEAGTIRETRLKFLAIYPDNWELMDVSLAKCTMYQDTISELALHIADGLGKREEYVDSLDITDRGTATSNVDATFSHFQFVPFYPHQLEFLKREIASQLLVALSEDLKERKSKVHILEYLVTGGTLFNELFMNKEKRINREYRTWLISCQTCSQISGTLACGTRKRIRNEQMSTEGRERSQARDALSFESDICQHTYFHRRFLCCS